LTATKWKLNLQSTIAGLVKTDAPLPTTKKKNKKKKKSGFLKKNRIAFLFSRLYYRRIQEKKS
jgi:hypothetical protein